MGLLKYVAASMTVMALIGCELVPHEHGKSGGELSNDNRPEATQPTDNSQVLADNQQPELPANDVSEADALDEALQSFMMLASIESDSAAEIDPNAPVSSDELKSTEDCDGKDCPKASPRGHFRAPDHGHPNPGMGWGVIFRKLFMFSDEMKKMILARFDTDKSGKISKEELMAIFVRKHDRVVGLVHAHAASKCEDQKPDAKADYRVSLCSRVKMEADANKDGKVSDEEMKAFEEARKKRFEQKQNRMILKIAALFCGSNDGLCEQKLMDEIKSENEQGFGCDLPPFRGVPGRPVKPQPVEPQPTPPPPKTEPKPFVIRQ